MKLYEKISLNQARKDLIYIRNTYGNPQDFCGSFCNNSILDGILMGKISIKEAIIENISYYFSNGLECLYAGCSSNIYPDKNDKESKRLLIDIV